MNIQLQGLATLHGLLNRPQVNKGYGFATPKLNSFGKRFRVYSEKPPRIGNGKDGRVKIFGGRSQNSGVVVLKLSRAFGFNGGGGGGGRGGGEDFGTARLLGNVALAVGLTYLSMTGQLGVVFDAIGWIFDALVSIWLIFAVVPLVGLGIFIWWAQRDILQSSCPNCGNEFQIFRSTLNDELQLCPFCTQPFSVKDNKFVRDSISFSNESPPFGNSSTAFSSAPRKDAKAAIVDIEADVKDAE